jgi:hypothetical protein
MTPKVTPSSGASADLLAVDNFGATTAGCGGLLRVEHFSLAGYDVQELLGFGATGEVWRAVERSSGETVALKRLHGAFESTAASPSKGDGASADSTAAVELRREAALLASVRHEHVVRLRSVVPTSAGLVLVLDYAAGGSLAALLAARGRLSAGEVVTVAAPLAQALGEVHARGLLHGDITPANIVFTAAGKPLLADLGIARLAGERADVRGGTPGFADPAVSEHPAGSAAADVYGLGATCFAVLSGRAPVDAAGQPAPLLGVLAPAAPVALVEAIESALLADPVSRPSAADFGRALFAACAPEPVRMVAVPSLDPAARPEPVTHRVGPAVRPVEQATTAKQPRGRWQFLRRPRVRRGSLLRRLAVAGVAAGLVTAAVAGGMVWATNSSRAQAGEPAPTGSAQAAALPAGPAAEPDWTATLAALDKQRDEAFADPDADALAAVYSADSPALATDRATLAVLVAAGEHAQGLALELVSVALSARASGQVSVLVTDVLPAYDVVGPAGSVTRVAGRGARRWLVVLRSTTAAGDWRIDSITSRPM